MGSMRLSLPAMASVTLLLRHRYSGEMIYTIKNLLGRANPVEFAIQAHQIDAECLLTRIVVAIIADTFKCGAGITDQRHFEAQIRSHARGSGHTEIGRKADDHEFVDCRAAQV